jgi:hypothetical protein
MFVLAWDGKGFQLDLTKLSDNHLDALIEWRNEQVEEENNKTPNA